MADSGTGAQLRLAVDSCPNSPGAELMSGLAANVAYELKAASRDSLLRTLYVKFGVAGRSGVEVEGGDGLLDALDKWPEERVLGCMLSQRGSTVVGLFSDDKTHFLGAYAVQNRVGTTDESAEKDPY